MVTMTPTLLVAMLACALVAPLQAKVPNVFLFLMDDMGHNDIGWNDDTIIMPNLQALAASGTILDYNYAQSLCSPSRGSLMFGKYASHTGMQHDVINFQTPECANLEDTMLPEKLKAAGYKSYMVGKWHLGFCKKECLPTSRGFDKFYGYWQPYTDYYSHSMGKPTDFGYDLHDMDEPATDNTTYLTPLFTEKAIKMIEDHDPEEPIFMYFAHMAVHAPLVVPQEYLDMYDDDDDTAIRKTLKAAVTCADDSFGLMIQAIKDAGLYDNSIILFSSDNGGQVNIGSNYPLRGAKLSVFEGGTRVPAMFHSPMQTVTGNRHTGLFHISDWAATVLSLAGIDADGLDGVDQTEMLFFGGESARDEIIYNIDTIYPQHYGKAAVRDNTYKLIKGFPGLYDGWDQLDGVGLTSDFKYITGGTKKRGAMEDDPFALDFESIDAYVTEIEDVYQLYNLVEDPNEENDLADDPEYADIITRLAARLTEYEGTAMEVDLSVQVDIPEGSPNNFGGIWSTGWC